jgi:hypothetical protein
MTSRQIPYVILEAHPDYKRPCAIQRLGLVEETNLHSSILDILVEFVYDRINIECVKSVEDIETFWSNFYGDRYMCMSPWDASAFIDGKWKDIYISNEELFEALIKEYQKAEQETKEEDVEEEDDEEDVEEEDDEN